MKNNRSADPSIWIGVHQHLDGNNDHFKILVNRHRGTNRCKKT